MAQDLVSGDGGRGEEVFGHQEVGVVYPAFVVGRVGKTDGAVVLIHAGKSLEQEFGNTARGLKVFGFARNGVGP